MKINEKTNILIVGLGIIGGSYARGLTKRGLKVHAIDTDRDTIEYALSNNIIYQGSVTADPEMIGAGHLV